MSNKAEYSTGKNIALKPNRKKFFTQQDLAGYAFSAPLVIGVLVFAIYPMVGALILSFKKSASSFGGEWTGLANYKYVLTDTMFWKSLYNTAYMGVLSVILGVSLSFILATLIHNVPWLKWRNFFKGVYFLPNVVSLVATSILFQFLFNPGSEGILNYVLGWVGIEPVGWFTNPSVSRFSIVLMTLWGMLGYNTIIFIAALSSVPRDLYEAAEVDGANWMKKWLYITVPYLKPILLFMVIISTIGAMKRFTDVWLIGGTAGNPAGSLMTVVLYIYRNAFLSNQMGVATAASYILFIVILVLTVIMLASNRKNNFD
ncbi:carbohydrate ABC transporter permease [Lederbergia lenta]|uniref:Sugar ABC transporter permease n=1 Tax=Lederbergia lenta TaxID=1467 RepID=A0A2X4VNK3_LEDLE|nr:sugar ABC transporter permease [Lederbergia lenta]MCM3110803.1 sugar ABC transporter permease [Lederbergia lenta]MEC2325802.1 sugar ABC transporter permease [Lederbergia lenta]SQI53726.1 sugar ABC transporter permease [Lederbergia lenta]